MSDQSLGITATELFACNPYRILGIPVTAEDDQVNAAYQKLLAMAGSPEADNYTTPFDFPSLPPFKRDETTVRTAYAKLASDGYRCFAYSDGIFSQALNIDDVMLNLEDISCYDCFLRCYMWLITNDRSFEEPELWVPLCKYIDKMIQSGPDQWGRYFDSRYPNSVIGSSETAAMEAFHTTFKDIILLPIKEMVRGSMKCRTATDILRKANVNVDEVFPDIDIPQANKPAPGQPAPKLKIAVKDGEEYFDVTTGKMVNFESENEAAVESNEFAAAKAISADAIVGEREPETSEPAPVPQNTTAEEPQERRVSLVPEEYETEEELPPVKHVEAIDVLKPRSRPKPVQEQTAPAADLKLTLDATAAQPAPEISFPEQNEAPKPEIYGGTQTTAAQAQHETPAPDKNLGVVETKMSSSEPYNPFAAAGGSMPSGKPAAVTENITFTAAEAPRRRKVSLTGLDGLSESAPAQDMPEIQLTAPKGTVQTAQHAAEEPVSAKKTSERRSLTDIIDEVESKTNESAEKLLTEQEEEDNLYTDALIKMLRSNKSNKMMKGVDTTHIFDNGDSLGQATGKKTVTMDAINMDRFDEKLLNSAYGNAPVDESDPKTAIRNKYKNINIDDMLNPTMGGKLNREYQPSAIDEYKKEKQQEKNFSKTLLKLFGFAILVVAIVAFLIIMTNG